METEPALGKSREVEALLGRKYQHGFVTDIESDSLPPGLDEDVVAAISRNKREPQFLLDWRLKAYRHWLTMREPAWAHVHYEPIDYQDISYYSAPKAPANAPKSLDEVDPKLLDTYAKLGIPLHERARLAGVAVDAVFDSVSVATTFKDKLSKAGVIFCSFSDAVRNHPELIERHLGTRRAAGGQFLRGAELGGVLRRLVRLRAAGRALSDGAVDVFPHQCGEDRPVRAHADRRGRGRARQLSGRLHGADARREPAARGGRRARRARRRADQVLDRAELVSRRRERARRHLQLRHQARRVPRPQLEDLLDAGGDRLRDHLEVPELRAARATTRSASSIRSRSPTTTSRPTPAPR